MYMYSFIKIEKDIYTIYKEILFVYFLNKWIFYKSNMTYYVQEIKIIKNSITFVSKIKFYNNDC